VEGRVRRPGHGAVDVVLHAFYAYIVIWAYYTPFYDLYYNTCNNCGLYKQDVNKLSNYDPFSNNVLQNVHTDLASEQLQRRLIEQLKTAQVLAETKSRQVEFSYRSWSGRIHQQEPTV
jgi:hypothetical protein